MDVSVASIKAAQEKARSLGIANVRFVGGDPRVRLAGETFDVVVDSQCVDCAEDSAGLIHWIAECLPDKGRFISVPALTSSDRARNYFDKLQRAGLRVIQSQEVLFSDLGELGAYGCYLAVKESGEHVIDPVKHYELLCRLVVPGSSSGGE